MPRPSAGWVRRTRPCPCRAGLSAAAGPDGRSWLRSTCSAVAVSCGWSELREGPVGFRDMQSWCDGLSPSKLSQRLTDLREAGLVTTDSGGRNELNEIGQGLLMSLEARLYWSHAWAAGAVGRPPR